MNWKTVNKKTEGISIRSYETFEEYYRWIFGKPIKRTLAGRNDRGCNIMYLRGTFGGGIRRRRQIFSMFKKGWYVHEQQMD